MIRAAARRSAAALLACALLGACGGVPRKPALAAPASSAANSCRSLGPGDAYAARQSVVAAPARRALVAAITAGAAPALALFDLDRGAVRWSTPVAASSRPQLLTDIVVTTEQHKLLAFDLQSGAQRWSVSFERAQWLGASQTGQRIAFTTTTDSRDPGERGSTVTARDASSGALLWQRRFGEAISRPTCLQDRCYVIAEHRDLLALDAQSGATLDCTTRNALELVWLDAADDGELLLGIEPRPGSRAELTAAPAEPVHLPASELPGQMHLRPSGYAAVPAARSAYGRIAMLAPLAPAAQGVAIRGERYYSLFYRDVFAHARDGSLAWARLLPSDVVAAAASAAGLVVVDEAGSVYALAAQAGELRRLGSFAAAVSSADLDAALPGQPASLPTAHAKLRRALTEIALDPDTRMLPARRLAVDALVASSEPEASSDLLEIYAHPSTPAALRERIAAGLPLRAVGTEYLVDALLAHRDFLDDTPAPPLRAIVPALVAQHQGRAVPRLIDQLFDPEVALDELTLVVDALAKLAGAEACAPLARFLALYHADSSFAQNPGPLLASAKALLACDDPQASGLAARLARRHETLPALQQALSSDSQTLPARAGGKAAAAPQAALPASLDAAALQRTFAEHAHELRECILAELPRRPDLSAVRIAFVAEHDGHASALRVTPDTPELRHCLEAKIRGYRFPRFRAGRKLASYVVSLRRSATTISPEAGSEAPAASEFWALSRARAQARAGSQLMAAAPWWQNQNPLYLSVEPQPSAGPDGAPSAASVPAGPLQMPAPAPTAPARPATAPKQTAGTQPQPAITKEPPATAPAQPAPAQAPAADDPWWLPVQP